MTTADQAVFDRLVKCMKRQLGHRRVDFGNFAARLVVNEAKVRTAELVFGRADLVQQVPGGFQVHRDAGGNVIDLSQRADE